MSSTVIIRDARPLDRDALAAIKVASWISTYAPLVPGHVLAPFVDPSHQLAAFERLLADRTQRVLVAVDDAEVGGRDGEVAGFIACEPAHPDGPYVDSLHIAPHRRSGGIGGRLLAAIAASLVADGFDSVHLHVLADNARARSFYERLGGRHVGTSAAEWAPDDVVEVTYRWDTLGALLLL